MRETLLQRLSRRLDAGSGQPNVPATTSDIAAVPPRVRVRTPDPASSQKTKGTWKKLLGLAVGIGVMLLAAFAGLNLDTGTLSMARPGQNPGR